MNIATYNLRKGGFGKTHWLKLVEQFSIDLVLVQESFSPDEHLPPLLHQTTRQNSVWMPILGCGWGSAIYSATGSLRRVPIVGFDGWVAGAEITGTKWQEDSESVLAISIHAPKRSGSYHAAVNQILDSLAQCAAGRPVIIGGDFNLTISEPSPTCQPASRQELAIHARLRDEFGLVNCWNVANPNKELTQTLRWSGDQTVNYHCDGIFVPRTWCERLKTCFVVSGPDWDKMSDHNPVVATFD